MVHISCYSVDSNASGNGVDYVVALYGDGVLRVWDLQQMRVAAEVKILHLDAHSDAKSAQRSNRMVTHGKIEMLARA